MKRSYKDANYDAITAYLGSIDWYGSFGCVNTVDKMYETFIAVLQHTIDIFVPVIKVLPQRSYLPNYFIALDQKRSKAYQKARCFGSAEAWTKFNRLNELFEKKLAKFSSSLKQKNLKH